MSKAGGTGPTSMLFVLENPALKGRTGEISRVLAKEHGVNLGKGQGTQNVECPFSALNTIARLENRPHAQIQAIKAICISAQVAIVSQSDPHDLIAAHEELITQLRGLKPGNVGLAVIARISDDLAAQGLAPLPIYLDSEEALATPQAISLDRFTAVSDKLAGVLCWGDKGCHIVETAAFEQALRDRGSLYDADGPDDGTEALQLNR